MTIDGLYEEHEESLQRQAFRLTRDTDAAEDLVQETFVRALGHRLLLAQLNRHQRLAWLRRTLKRLFLDRRAERQRRAALLEVYGREVPAAVDPEEVDGVDPFDLAPAEDRELLEMRYRQGLSSVEIAAELDLPPGTVRWRLHRAVRRMRAHKHRFL
ncbi:MAG: hypothetical protein OXG13_15470 [Gemmatimonadaceae bacterium]|nr:hypothetical protein [Gemmatimonadaceae bacterium]